MKINIASLEEVSLREMTGREGYWMFLVADENGNVKKLRRYDMLAWIAASITKTAKITGADALKEEGNNASEKYEELAEIGRKMGEIIEECRNRP